MPSSLDALLVRVRDRVAEDAAAEEDADRAVARGFEDAFRPRAPSLEAWLDEWLAGH